jgi:hypothetical protein
MIFKLLRKYLKDEEFIKLLQDKETYKNNFSEISNQYIELLKKNDYLNKENEKLTNQINEVMHPMNELENYWNNKYPSSIITYNCQHTPNKGGYSLDVRWFFGNTEVSEIQNIIKEWNNLTNDEKMINCQTWVKDNIIYRSDGVNYNLNEYWGDAIETLKFKTGDCDNGAILMANLALACGIPYWRVRLTAGGVRNANGDFAGYHAFLTYLPDSEIDKIAEKQDWKVCDWCYYTDIRPFNERTNYKDNILYDGDIWFSFNKKLAFSKQSTRLKY